MSTGNRVAPAIVQPVWRIRLVRLVLVSAGLALWFLTQALIGQRDNLAGDYGLVGELLTHGDASLVATETVNRVLHENRRWADALLISSSAVIDLLGVFLLAWAIFGPSFRPFLGLVILFALRQLSQVLCVLPAPDGIIWESPGFPSLHPTI